MAEAPLVTIALSGSDPNRIARQLLARVPAFAAPASSVKVDGGPQPAGPIADWIGRGGEVRARWGSGVGPFLTVHAGERMVKARFAPARLSAAVVLELLETIDFEVASFRELHDEWAERGWHAPGFSDLHFAHGWACAFRGAGHERLVSRRWLDFGPWIAHRGAHDTTLVQFHDLAADAGEAWKQARPGHERMGISDRGGFLQSEHVYRHDLAGVYLAKLRSHRVLVVDRDVGEREMLDACAMRREKAGDPDKPIQHVGFVFMDREHAERHLHELWLRELECWSMGPEVRLDEAYRPAPPAPPAWKTSRS